jgi:hypothetical protein
MIKYIIITLLTFTAKTYGAEAPLTWSNQAADDAMLKANGVEKASAQNDTSVDPKPVDVNSVIDPNTLENIRKSFSGIKSPKSKSSTSNRSGSDSKNSQTKQDEEPNLTDSKTKTAKDQLSTSIDKAVETESPSAPPTKKQITELENNKNVDPYSKSMKQTRGVDNTDAVDPFSPPPSVYQKAQTRDPQKGVDNNSILERTSSTMASDQNLPGTSRSNAPTEIVITDSKNPSRGINVRHEMPSVRHVTMSPGNKWFGGDDVEISISPIFDIVMQMPEAIDWFNPSSDSLLVSKIPNQPTLLKLKLKPIDSPVPMSLQIVDVNQKIWTFTVVGVRADLATEYPKTIIINKKVVTKTQIGAKNPSSIINALPVDYAVQMVVGDAPNTSEFKVDLLGATYMHHEGYAQYLFGISKKDGGAFEKIGTDATPALKFTMWANNHRIDGGGNKYEKSSDDQSVGLTKKVEWTIDTSTLSKAATRKSGKETYIVICQVRASILDLEDYSSAFITISDKSGYTRFDFKPYSRDFRAPTSYQENGEE